jgi:hypothetical protein
MPSVTRWRITSRITVTDEGTRAVDALQRIQDRPTSVTLFRNESALAAQTVRLDYSEATTSAERRGVAGQPSERQLIIFGVRNHPDAAVLNTDIQRGDIFKYGGASYSIVDVILLPGEVQAYTERLQSGG